MNFRRSLPEIRCLPVCPWFGRRQPVTPRSRTAGELADSAPSVRGSLRHLADEVFRFQLVQQLAQLALIDPGVQPERPRLDDEARGPLLNWGQT